MTSATTLTVRNPWDGSTIGELPLANPETARAAGEAAAAIALTLRQQSALERSALLHRIRAGAAARSEALTATIIAESGKPRRYAAAEVARALQTLQAAAEEANRFGGEIVPLDWAPAGAGTLAFTQRVPIGPVFGISPFNFPLNLLLHKVAPAIAAGCPIVHKPASAVPLTAMLMGEIIAAAAALPGQVQILPMTSGLAEEQVRSGPYHGVSFTGSAGIGWHLKSVCGRKRITLELGGNAAAILAPDAELDRALPECIEAAFAYAGQVCISLQRLLIPQALYDSVRDQIVSLAESVAVGDPSDPATIVGPLITAGEADRAADWIAQAESAGARRLCGGERWHPQGLTPAVLEHVDPAQPLYCEEAFAPVLVLIPYRAWDDALRLANDSAYGLQAAVYTQDLRRIRQAHAALEVGGVIVNGPPTYRVDSMPYGGIKGSGFGREGVRYAMEALTEPRLCVVRE